MDFDKLNRDFYLKTQEYFNRSRQRPWLGWKKLLPHLPNRELFVLDLGCGNGRFGVWLSTHHSIAYTGVDSNQYLLDRATEALPSAKLIKADILHPLLVRGRFDLVAILGVMHHLSPAAAAGLIRRAAAKLKPEGILFLSFWEFNKSSETKIIKDLGNNDYLVDWRLGVTAERFCHLYTDPEISSLLAAANLSVLADFRADTSNRYLLLQKPKSGKSS
ncbi:MAG TPA: class I SAM-dependent methyltransferase [Patescibacteria group bacterium]|nr:class I SAM-dependent methyltransferase [Patescibacteria group bacterium]